MNTGNYPKKQKHCQMNELTEGDCWVGMTQASRTWINFKCA